MEMNELKEFNRIMAEQKAIALATCGKKDLPNVRIVNYYYDAGNKGVLYFSTFRNNPKTREFAHNNNVAFTTIPAVNNEHVRVHEATVRKSDLTIYDLKEAFIRKIPDYEMTIDQAGSKMDLYEIHFIKASVTLDFNRSGKVTL
jgi:uncharacterized pyridoxamine 5'-phosphate oxidase family protein